VSPPRKGKQHSRPQGASQRKRPPAQANATAITDAVVPSLEDELFASLRSGAANVAGVSYQIAVSALLLASGRANTVPGLQISSVCPEGFEDVDCQLDDGSLLLVQTKERGPGARAIANAELAEIIAHAAPALHFTAGAAAARVKQGAREPMADPPRGGSVPTSRFAVLTDGIFGSSLPVTGWTTNLAEALAGLPRGQEIAESLLAALCDQLERRKLPRRFASELLTRTHLVTVPSDLGAQTIQLLQSGLSIHPAVASIVRAELLRDLTEMGARQRQASLGTAERRTRSDLDTLAARIAQAIDVSGLEEAIRAGVCEPADYVSASPVDAAGFLFGVDVTPAHIAAGLDVLRPEETTAILDALATRRHVVVAGPSGSGKSALLWRTARLVERGPQILRVLRVADPNDVELLVRHVRRRAPHPDIPVLVCADDLGRSRMASWSEARRRLSEMPGVLILGAARREDLTPELSADATVVDPRLTDTAAGQIYDAIATAGLPTVLEREEAMREAKGLLMEFIALTTTGHRIREVLARQVASLAGPHRHLEREALRLVCAAHTLGLAVQADTLPAALEAEPAEVGDALQRLAGEHLLVATRDAWQGLHDLRTELLLDLLHSTPPPTLSATYGRVLALLPKAAHAQAARRAAVRLARAAAPDHPGMPVAERLESLQEALRPVAEAIGRQLTQLEDGPPGDDLVFAKYAAGLLEAADRLDTVAYAHAILPLLEERRPPTLDVTTLAFMVYSVAVDDLTFDIDGLQEMVQLAQELPPRATTCAQTVGGAFPPTLLARLARATDVGTAVRLCEAAENLLTLTAEQASTIYHSHIAALPAPPGSDDSIEAADRRAQLTASLASLAQLRGQSVAEVFGPTLARAEDAVSSDPYGCRVELARQPAEPVQDVVKNLARTTTYDPEQMLVIDAIAFARTADEPPTSAYRTQPGDNPTSLNAQVVLLARRLFDACPEVDLINAEVWQANRRPQRILDHEEGVKTLRAGVLPRGRETSRSIAFQAAVAETLSAGSWTTRLRSQAEIARQLVTLLEELPARLRPTDNQHRQREWVRNVELTASGVSALPGRPAEQQAVLGTAQTATLDRTAADIDEEMRAKDAAKSALDALAGVLLQVARGLEDLAALRGAGFRLASVPVQLQRARQQGAPSFAGIGETLPQSLDTLATFGARLLSGLGRAELKEALRSARVGPEQLDALLTKQARVECAHDGQTTIQRLAAVGVTAEAVVNKDPKPVQPWQDQRALVLVDLDDWSTVVPTLQGWTKADREASGILGRVIILPVEDGTIMPLGLHFFGAGGEVIPLPEDEFADVATALALPRHTGRTSAAIAQPSQQLVAYSYEQIRRASRDSTWHPVPTRAPTPPHIAAQISERFAAVLARVENNAELEQPESQEAAAARAMLELCQAVSAETGRDFGLAHQLADVDITAMTTPEPKTTAYLFSVAQAAALQADRAAQDGPIAGSLNR
jgi:hypothetical protein